MNFENNYKLNKQAKSILIAIGLTSILSACKKIPDSKYEIYTPATYTVETSNINTYSKGYKPDNNGYRMKILTIENEVKKENIIGYFDITNEVNFNDIVNNKTYNLSEISKDNSINIYISDISNYINIEKVGGGLNSRIITSLYQQINNNFKIDVEKSELQITNKLIFNEDESKYVIILDITDYIKNYSNNESKEIIENVVRKK